MSDAPLAKLVDLQATSVDRMDVMVNDSFSKVGLFHLFLGVFFGG